MKILWEQEKMLIASTLSFSNIFSYIEIQKLSFDSQLFCHLQVLLFWTSLTHYQTKILDSSKLKKFADDNFKFDENVRKLSKRVENTVGNGEIARDEQFLHFPQCFQKTCFPGASKGVIVWEWVDLSSSMLLIWTTKKLCFVVKG